MCFGLGCQARCQHQISQEQDTEDDSGGEEGQHLGFQQDTEDDSGGEEGQHLGFQDSGINTAITEAVEPQPLTIEAFAYVEQNEQGESASQY